MSSDREYCIVRFRMNGGSEVVAVDLTQEQAVEHCRRADTRGDGWFDGFDLMSERPAGVEAFRMEQELNA